MKLPSFKRIILSPILTLVLYIPVVYLQISPPHQLSKQQYLGLFLFGSLTILQVGFASATAEIRRAVRDVGGRRSMSAVVLSRQPDLPRGGGFLFLGLVFLFFGGVEAAESGIWKAGVFLFIAPYIIIHGSVRMAITSVLLPQKPT